MVKIDGSVSEGEGKEAADAEAEGIDVDDEDPLKVDCAGTEVIVDAGVQDASAPRTKITHRDITRFLTYL